MMRTLLFALAISVASPQANQPEPVVWSAPATPVSGAAVGGKLSVNLNVKIAAGWYIYALTQAQGGPTPLTITVPANQPFKLAGTITAPKPDVKFDPGFGMEVHQLRNGGDFVLPITVAKAPPGKRTMAVEARYQVCNANLCFPAKTVRIDVPVVLK